MVNQKKRINTIIALINGYPLGFQRISHVKTEFKKAIDIEKFEPTQRRNLYKMFHTSRALDTFLQQFLTHYGIIGNRKSLGAYLHQLSKHSLGNINKISESQRSFFQRNIVDIRNRFMHLADSYPQNDSQVNTIINEMHSLVTIVICL